MKTTTSHTSSRIPVDTAQGVVSQQSQPSLNHPSVYGPVAVDSHTLPHHQYTQGMIIQHDQHEETANQKSTAQHSNVVSSSSMMPGTSQQPVVDTSDYLFYYPQGEHFSYYPHDQNQGGIGEGPIDYDMYNNGDVFSAYYYNPYAHSIEGIAHQEDDNDNAKNTSDQAANAYKNYYASSYAYYEQPQQQYQHMPVQQEVPVQDEKEQAHAAKEASVQSSQQIEQSSYYPTYYYPAQSTGIPTNHSNSTKSAHASSQRIYGIHPADQIYCDPSYYEHQHHAMYASQQNQKKLHATAVVPRRAKDNKHRDFNDENNTNDDSSQNIHLQKQMLAPTGKVLGVANAMSNEIRKRKRKNNDQLKVLKIEYSKGGFWGKEKISEVSQTTGLSESQVYKWCWDQKKKRLENFKRKLGGKLMLQGLSEAQLEEMMLMSEMSGCGDDNDALENNDDDNEDGADSYHNSTEKFMKLNDGNASSSSLAVNLKANISKLSNDFTISQLQERVIANKSRALQNITDNVLSKQNSSNNNNNSVQVGMTKKVITSSSSNNNNNTKFDSNNQENIRPIDKLNQLQQQRQLSKNNSVF